MKKSLTFILFLCFRTVFSQDINCLKSNLYDYYNDLVSVEVNSDIATTDLDKYIAKTDSLQIIVLPSSYDDFPKYSSKKREGVEKGFKVLVVNNSSTDFNARNMDGRILFLRQTYYNNKWINLKPFVKKDYGFCGNSFMTTAIIKSGQIISFIAPCIEGNTKAKFRFVLNEKGTDKIIISNEFEGYLDERLIKSN